MSLTLARHRQPRSTDTPIVLDAAILIVVLGVALVASFYLISAFSWQTMADYSSVKLFHSVLPFLPDTLIADCTNMSGLSDPQQIACLNEFGPSLLEGGNAWSVGAIFPKSN